MPQMCKYDHLVTHILASDVKEGDYELSYYDILIELSDVSHAAKTTSFRHIAGSQLHPSRKRVRVRNDDSLRIIRRQVAHDNIPMEKLPENGTYRNGINNI